MTIKRKPASAAIPGLLSRQPLSRCQPYQHRIPGERNANIFVDWD